MARIIKDLGRFVVPESEKDSLLSGENILELDSRFLTLARGLNVEEIHINKQTGIGVFRITGNCTYLPSAGIQLHRSHGEGEDTHIQPQQANTPRALGLKIQAQQLKGHLFLASITTQREHIG